MTPLSQRLYTAAAIRRIEQTVIEGLGVPGFELMQRAGRAVPAQAAEVLDGAQRVLVLCGPGNNGGDGYIVAGLLRAAGQAVRVISLTDPERLRGDAALARDRWLMGGGQIEPFAGELPAADAIVDALLGIGLERPLRGGFLVAVQLVNEAGVPVVAVDIPTGLHADRGEPLGTAVRAAVTVTFIGRKLGLYTGRGADYRGTVRLATLDCPAEAYADVRWAAELDDPGALPALLPGRPLTAHKGDFGHVLVVGGAVGMSGAARLAAEAAARGGAGLVSVATSPTHAAVLNAGRPELMVRGVAEPDDLAPLLARATHLVVGPGLGGGAWGEALWRAALDSGRPLVLDADGLNLLARHPGRRDDWILTPHPGEAGRLLDSDAAAVQADRHGAAVALQRRYGGVVVLKGRGTLVAAPDGVWLADVGNPGMASGGMGDVLAGLLGALWAQGLSAPAAARAAVLAHGRAADLAADDRWRGLLAGDLLTPLRGVLNP